MKIRGVEFLWYVVSWLARNRIEEIVVCAGRFPEDMAAESTSPPYPSVRLTFSVEDHPLGTAGAVRNALEHLADEFILINGDTFLPIEYAPILAHWEKTKRAFDCLMLAYDNRENIAPNDTAIDSEGVVVAYSKRSPARMQYVNAGLVVVKKSVFEGLPPGVHRSLEVDIFPELLRRRKMAALVTPERYYDIGTPERLRTFEEYVDRHPEVVPR